MDTEAAARTAFDAAQKILVPLPLQWKDFVLAVSSPPDHNKAIEDCVYSIYHYWYHKERKQTISGTVYALIYRIHYLIGASSGSSSLVFEPSSNANLATPYPTQQNDSQMDEVNRQITLLSEKNLHVGRAVRESQEIKGICNIILFSLGLSIYVFITLNT